MRGIYSSVTDIRRQVFTEVARLAFEGGDYKRMDEIPYKIIPGEISHYRESVFLERAIIGERLRLAMGLPLRRGDEHAPISQGVEDSAVAEKYYDPPLVNIIPFACHACPHNLYKVTDMCQGCLAHPCVEVCPKNAVQMVDGKARIDQSKCVKCGLCKQACPYSVIVKMERPCAMACGVDAIGSDEYGRAVIDQDKCVSCGMCLVNCPFGAIADKGQIFQMIHALKSENPVIAIVAPSFAGQLGPGVTEGKLKSALLAVGFTALEEVAVGADLCTIEEAKDFLEKVPEKQPFMATSCCPAWSAMAKKLFPDMAPYVSMALTPMVLTARLQKQKNPHAKVVFIGPCAAKKLEASRRRVRSAVDFVLTYEEMMGVFLAKGIDVASMPEAETFPVSTKDGRGFPVAGGVSAAVVHTIQNLAPDRQVEVVNADGLRNCRNMLMVARSGKYDGFLLEGMACPGGCVGGAGTLQTLAKANQEVGKYKAAAPLAAAVESPLEEHLHEMQNMFRDEEVAARLAIERQGKTGS